MFYAIYMATRPRACACILHKTLGLMVYLLHIRKMPASCDMYSVSSMDQQSGCLKGTDNLIQLHSEVLLGIPTETYLSIVLAGHPL